MAKKVFLSVVVIIPILFLTSTIAQTNWIKDPNNPILKRDTVIANLPNDYIAISDCWVMKDGLTYKMWYTCGGMNYPTDTLLRSRLCYAESSDGVNWNKHLGNPILDVSYTGGWDSLGVETASVIIDDLAPASERYKMWYAGQTFNSYRYEIGYAFSPDGINWTKHSNPVLEVGATSEWDNGFLEGPSVIKDGNTYKMWYCGYDAVVDFSGTDGHANVGYATSVDGVNWVKHTNNPILTTGTNSWDSISVQDPHVIKQDEMYYMWYGGNNVDGYGQKVGYAWSSDGINWTKSNANPVLTNGATGTWDVNTASFPSVMNDDGTYKMWYTGKDVDPTPNSTDYYWEIGYAVDSMLLSVFNSNESKLNIYPNPSQRILNVGIPVELSDAEITIYDQYGKVVKPTMTIKNGFIRIETHDLADGIYILALKNEVERLNVKFIVSN